MKWQPPIPSGKLTSKPVREVGAAVVFLLWCYDAVQRDGAVEFQVAEVADDLGESYYTVRKWWSAVKSGPWFAEVHDRGRRGFRVVMAADWLSWRSRGPSSNAGEVPNPVLEDTDVEVPEQVLEAPEVAVKSSSNAGEVPNPVLGGRVYKVLQDDHKTHVAPLAQKRDRAARPKAEPASPSEVREAIAKGSAIDLRSGLKADILQVNDAGRRLWRDMRQPEQTVDSFVSDIRYVGKWIRKTQHPYKGSEQRIPPSALIKFWPAAMEARRSPAHLNGAHVNGIGPPLPQPARLTPAEIAARMTGEPPP